MKNSINIYGAGINAALFITNIKMHYDIKYVITGDEDSRNEFLGYKLIKYFDAKKILKERFTIVTCSEEAYWPIKDKLTKIGLYEFQDFIYFSLFEKKMVVMYGNCHTLPIKQYLNRIPEFVDNYGIYPLPPICDIKANGGWEKYDRTFLEHCDVFIHQSIWDKNVYGVEYSSNKLIEQLAVKCNIVAIPNLYRLPMFMFPQAQYSDPVLLNSMNYFPAEDTFIESQKSIRTAQEITKAIEHDEIFNEASVLDGKPQFFDKIAMREKDWDIKMSEFIEKNFHKQLFYDPNHPTELVINYIIFHLSHILGLNKEYRTDGLLRLDTHEIPVYGCVRRYLKLEYTNDELRKTGMKLKPVMMNLNEYVCQYIAWNESRHNI